MKLAYVPREEIARALDAVAVEGDRHAAFADLCRLNTLYMIMRAGSGHIGTSFSSIDLVSWLMLNVVRPQEPNERAIYFSSKGHDVPALYSVLIALGALEFDRIHMLRRLDGLPGHPDVGTPHIVANTGSLGMGISKAKGMVIANRLADRPVPIFVLTGDGELQEGQFWESLPSAVHGRMGEITVIVDHNKLQSDTFVARVNDLGDVEARLASCGWHVVRRDGHDPSAIAATFAELNRITDRPKVWIADTIKGRGVSFMEHTALRGDEWLYRYHSGAPSEAEYAAALAELTEAVNRRLLDADQPEVQLAWLELPTRRPPPPAAQRLVAAYSEALVEAAGRDERIVALDGDLMVDCGLLPFRDRFPDRFVEAGIAEQDMVSMAGGMALRGMLPIVHSFACFLSTRPNEQIYNNATEQTKIIYVASLAGLVPAGPGHSHQSVRDISALGAVPGLVLIEPSCEAEVKMAVDFAVRDSDQSCYLRLFTPPIELPYELPADYRLTLGRGLQLTSGQDAALFSYGPTMLSQAVRASGLLHARGIGLAVYNLPWLNRVDPAWLADAVGSVEWVFTLDDHYVTQGQGDLILSALMELERPLGCRARKLGLTEIPHCGANDEVLEAHRLDEASLADTIEAAVGNRQATAAMGGD
jgi:transketolase